MDIKQKIITEVHADVSNFLKNMDKVKVTLGNVNQSVTTLTQNTTVLNTQLNQNQGLQNTTTAAAATRVSLEDLAKSIRNMTIAMTAALSVLGVGLIKAAADFEGITEVTRQTFGKNGKEMSDWAENSLRDFGLAKTSALDYASTLGSIGKAQGLQAEKFKELSKMQVQLISDISLFKNKKPEDVFNAIANAATGQAQALQKMGFVINQSAIETYLLEEGLGRTYNTLSEGEKNWTRTQILIQQTADYSNNFKENFKEMTFETQFMKLKESFKELKTELGERLLPTAIKILNAINNIIDAYNGLSDTSKNIIFGVGMYVAVNVVVTALAVQVVLLVGAITAFHAKLIISAPFLAFQARMGAINGAMITARLSALSLTTALAAMSIAISVVSAAVISFIVIKDIFDIKAVQKNADEVIKEIDKVYKKANNERATTADIKIILEEEGYVDFKKKEDEIVESITRIKELQNEITSSFEENNNIFPGFAKFGQHTVELIKLRKQYGLTEKQAVEYIRLSVNETELLAKAVDKVSGTTSNYLAIKKELDIITKENMESIRNEANSVLKNRDKTVELISEYEALLGVKNKTIKQTERMAALEDILAVAMGLTGKELSNTDGKLKINKSSMDKFKQETIEATNALNDFIKKQIEVEIIGLTKDKQAMKDSQVQYGMDKYKRDRGQNSRHVKLTDDIIAENEEMDNAFKEQQELFKDGIIEREKHIEELKALYVSIGEKGTIEYKPDNGKGVEAEKTQQEKEREFISEQRKFIENDYQLGKINDEEKLKRLKILHEKTTKSYQESIDLQIEIKKLAENIETDFINSRLKNIDTIDRLEGLSNKEKLKMLNEVYALTNKISVEAIELQIEITNLNKTIAAESISNWENSIQYLLDFGIITEREYREQLQRLLKNNLNSYKENSEERLNLELKILKLIETENKKINDDFLSNIKKANETLLDNNNKLIDMEKERHKQNIAAIDEEKKQELKKIDDIIDAMDKAKEDSNLNKTIQENIAIMNQTQFATSADGIEAYKKAYEAVQNAEDTKKKNILQEQKNQVNAEYDTKRNQAEFDFNSSVNLLEQEAEKIKKNYEEMIKKTELFSRQQIENLQYTQKDIEVVLKNMEENFHTSFLNVIKDVGVVSGAMNNLFNGLYNNNITPNIKTPTVANNKDIKITNNVVFNDTGNLNKRDIQQAVNDVMLEAFR